jgi:hypothetical protein
MDVYWYLVPRDGFYQVGAASLLRVARWFADEKIIPTVPDVANFVYHVG